jgi:hypothetical protein
MPVLIVGVLPGFRRRCRKSGSRRYFHRQESGPGQNHARVPRMTEGGGAAAPPLLPSTNQNCRPNAARAGAAADP